MTSSVEVPFRAFSKRHGDMSFEDERDQLNDDIRHARKRLKHRASVMSE